MGTHARTWSKRTFFKYAVMMPTKAKADNDHYGLTAAVKLPGTLNFYFIVFLVHQTIKEMCHIVSCG